jgi:predicted regulator of Ras-like GTPase activity (Roadblock/LC7/MglB family)
VFRALDDDLFLAVVVAPDGNLGKARYLIRRNLVAIRAEL